VLLQLVDFAGVLSAADAADADEWQRGEVDALSFVYVGAVVVFGAALALEYGDDRQVGRHVAQPQVVGDSAMLVGAQADAGARQDVVSVIQSWGAQSR
jgi:hypothetical protein